MSIVTNLRPSSVWQLKKHVCKGGDVDIYSHDFKEGKEKEKKKNKSE